MLKRKILHGSLPWCFMLLFMSSANSQGLVAYWNFDEGQGDSTYDISGNGNHFSLSSSVQWVDGIKGKALNFNGVDGEGICADKPNQTGMTALTLSAVIWIDDYPTNYQWGPIVGKWGPGGSEDDAWALDVDRGSTHGVHGVVVGSSSQTIYGNNPIPLQRWNHIVFTWDGYKECIYLNGVKTDSSIVSYIGPIQPALTEIRLGHNVDPHHFKGNIDELRIYNIALSPTQIKAQYDSLGIPQVSPGPISYSTNPAVYQVGTAIIANVCSNGGGVVDSFMISPALPAGLSFNKMNGTISGTSTVVSTSQTYTITAKNNSGIATVNMTITITNPQPPLLVAHWTFDSVSSQTYYDVTKNGYDASSDTKLDLSAGVKGNALVCNGNNFKIGIQNSIGKFDFPTFTIEAWVYSDQSFIRNDGGTGDSTQAIFNYTVCGESGTGIGAGYGMHVTSAGNLQFSVAGKGGSPLWVMATSQSILQSGRWNHVVATYDGAAMKVFINGLLEGTTANTSGYVFSNESPYMKEALIGMAQLSSQRIRNWFNGKIDELSLYNYALSADSIAAHYYALIVTIPVTRSPAFAHWTFDDTTKVDSVYDLSGNNNHFKLYNSPRFVKGINGHALELDGTSSMGLCASNSCQSGMTALTIEAVIMVNSYSTNYEWGPIINKWGPGGYEDDSWSLDVDRNAPYGLHGVAVGNTTSKALYTQKVVPLQQWIHCVFTWDGIKELMFVNGVKTDSADGSGVGFIQNTNTELRLGINPEGQHFKGFIDEIALYNRVLTQSEIISRYDSLIRPDSISPVKPVKINFGMKTAYVNPGDEIWMPLYLTNYADYAISAAQFAVQFDTSVITFEDMSLDSGIAKTWMSSLNKSKKESIVIALAGMSTPLKYGEGELARLLFKVNPNAQNKAYSDISFADVNIDETNSVIMTTVPGKIIIDNVSVLYGDVTGNKVVNVFDAQKILEYVVGSLKLPDVSAPNFTTAVADVSGNGIITSYDAALVFQYSVGLISQFPVDKTSQSALSKKAVIDTSGKADLSLVAETGNTETVYRLYGSNLKGFVAGDFAIQYDPLTVDISNGDIKSPVRGIKVTSQVDASKNLLKLAMTTNDYIGDNSQVELLDITVPKVAGSTPGTALILAKALLNEGKIVSNVLSEGLLSDVKNKGFANAVGRDIVTGGRHVIINNIHHQPVQVELFTIKGQQVLSQKYQPDVSVINISFNRFPTGLYIQKISLGSKVQASPLLIK